MKAKQNAHLLKMLDHLLDATLQEPSMNEGQLFIIKAALPQQFNTTEYPFLSGIDPVVLSSLRISQN
ncbi:MAG: hypothetical protein V4714_20830 [Bacteroidota bacterium]